MGHNGFATEVGRTMGIVAAVFMSIATLSTVMRIVSHKMRRLPLGLDDLFAILGTVVVVTACLVGVVAVSSYGMGYHAKQLSFDENTFILKALWVLEILYGLSLTLTKTSMLIFLYKLFASKQSVKVAIYITLAWVLGWGVAVVIASIFLCEPIEHSWYPNDPGKCGDRNAFFMAAGALNVVNDFVIMAIPIPNIWSLQLPTGRRIGLIAAFAVGTLMSIVSILRVINLYDISYADVPATLPGPLSWTFLEITFAVIATNIPLLRPIAMLLKPSHWSGKLGTHKQNPYAAWGTDQDRQTTPQKSGGLSRMGGETTKLSTLAKQNTDTGRWSDDTDARSDVELAYNGAEMDGIHVRTEVHVEAYEHFGDDGYIGV